MSDRSYARPGGGRPRETDLAASDTFNVKLWRLHTEEELSARTLADRYNLHISTVWRRIQKARERDNGKHKIEARDRARSEALADSLRWTGEVSEGAPSVAAISCDTSRAGDRSDGGTGMTPSAQARIAFDEYAAMDEPELPEDPLSALQVRLARWQNLNFGPATAEQLALGVAEEAGELCHAVLKRSQRIRGMGDPVAFRFAAGDALADVTIYAMQMATLQRMDLGTLLRATAEVVMQRDWTKENG